MARSRNSADPVVDALLIAAEGGRSNSARSPSVEHPWLIAFSGGLDSTVLLHAATGAFGAAAIVAAHVDHGLQSQSASWERHCADIADQLGVRFLSDRLPSSDDADNLEQWARDYRYASLVQMAGSLQASAILTAHHQDDQLETLLLALARGAGLEGLTGIAFDTLRSGVPLLRPLLELDRTQIKGWAGRHQLVWIEDPMNAWSQLRRTAIRQLLVPQIDSVLPGVRRHLAQTMSQLREARTRLDQLAQDDLASVRAEPRALHALGLDGLSALDGVRQRAVLRAWIASIGLRMPTRARLLEMQSQWLHARSSHSEIRHEGWRLTRQGRRLFAWSDDAHPVALRPQTSIDLPPWQGKGQDQTLSLRMHDGSCLLAQSGPVGLCPDWLARTSFRLVRPPAQMSVRLQHSDCARMLRKLWQEWELPVSVRAACGLVLANGQPFWIQPFGLLAGPWPMVQSGKGIRWMTAMNDPRSVPRPAFRKSPTDFQ
jgi:tRNA(Ile)-lysidine synthetase-like protein